MKASSFGAALLAIYVIPAYTWRGMFMIAAIPVAVLLVFVWRIPESIRFLTVRGKDRSRVADLLGRIDPAYTLAPDVEFVVNEPRAEASVETEELLPGSLLHVRDEVVAVGAAVQGGVDIAITPQAVISLTYDGTFSSKVKNNTFRGGFIWKF